MNELSHLKEIALLIRFAATIGSKSQVLVMCFNDLNADYINDCFEDFVHFHYLWAPLVFPHLVFQNCWDAMSVLIVWRR